MAAPGPCPEWIDLIGYLLGGGLKAQSGQGRARRRGHRRDEPARAALARDGPAQSGSALAPGPPPLLGASRPPGSHQLSRPQSRYLPGLSPASRPGPALLTRGARPAPPSAPVAGC